LSIIQGMEQVPLGQHPLLGPALLVLTDIISDPYPGHSVLPTRCRVSYDRRLLPGETRDGVLGAIRALRPGNGAEFRAVIAEGEHASYTGQVLRQQKFFPAWVFDEAHPFVQAALSGLRSAGLDPKLGAYRFCTNAAYSAGQAGVPTVGFGPAAEGDAHVVDERLELRALHKAAEGYLGIINATLEGQP
jgi:acetylornithine deacetylase/succinyl-diaminopimelate desuccinylase-like protein